MQVRNFTGKHTVKEIAGFLKMSDRTVREQLQALAEMGAVKQARESRGPIPATWQITADLQLAAGADNPLPSVEEVSGVEEQLRRWACTTRLEPPSPADRSAAVSLSSQPRSTGDGFMLWMRRNWSLASPANPL